MRATSAAVAGAVCALVGLLAYFAYAALAPRPAGKASIYFGMSLATFLVGAGAWALADAAGGARAACRALYPAAR